MIKLLIGDDQLLVRAGLKMLLADESDMTVVDEAGDGAEALRYLQTRHYDVVLLDIGMPVLDGLQVLRQIKAEKPTQRVLIISNYPEKRYALRAMRAGADGYLTKDFETTELVKAIRLVAAGRRYISPSLAERLLMQTCNGDAMACYESLSEREHQVLDMLVAGRSLTEIADKLCISPKTVTGYRARLLEKMHMTSNAELIQFAIEHGLAD